MFQPQTEEEWSSFWEQDSVDNFPPDLRLARAIKELFKDERAEHYVVCGEVKYFSKDAALGYDLRTVDSLGRVVSGYVLYESNLAHKNFVPNSSQQILMLDLTIHSIKTKPCNAVVLDGGINLYFKRSKEIIESLDQMFVTSEMKEFSDYDLMSYQ